jgi:phosphoribosyl 1,2-cyclic phosphate phosphodiesterase
MNYIKLLNPEKTILTNLHSDIDYTYLKKKLSKTSLKILPAFDRLKIVI